MPSRFFLKGIRAKAVVRPPKPLPVRPPDHRRKVVMAVRLRATGTAEHMAMSSRHAAQVLGGQKGGLRSAALGVAHRWTPDTARKAAIKSWTKRRKFNKRINARVGVAAHRQPTLWREPLRAYYAENPTRGIQYCPPNSLSSLKGMFVSGQWVRVTITDKGTETRILSERAALIALGHLKSPRGYIPDSIAPVPRTGRSVEKRHR